MSKYSYDFLKMQYERAEQVCDPVSYAYRQKALLNCLAEYLLERDKPKERQEKYEIEENFQIF